MDSQVTQGSRPVQNDVLLDRAYRETRKAIYGCVMLSVLAISLLSIPVRSAPSKLREETWPLGTTMLVGFVGAQKCT